MLLAFMPIGREKKNENVESITVDEFKETLVRKKNQTKKLRAKMLDAISNIRDNPRDTVIKKVPVLVDRIVEVEKEVKVPIIIHDTIREVVTRSIFNGQGYNQSNNLKLDTNYIK